MSDFLARLAERQLTDDPGIAPTLPSRFGPEVQEAEPVERPLDTRAVPVAEAPRMPAAPRAVATESIERPPIFHSERIESTHERVVHDNAAPPDRTAVTSRPTPMQLPSEVWAGARPKSAVAPSTPFQPDSPVVRRSHAVEIVEKLRQIVPGEATRVDQVSGPAQPLVPPRTEGPELILQSSMPQPVSKTDAPVVTVTIGRVEVRAVVPPPAKERPKSEGHKALALEDYLERRHGRRR